MLSFQQFIFEGPGAVLAKAIPKGTLSTFKAHLTDTMPAGKVQHSLRVGATLAKAGVPSDIITAALFHDFLERGGDPQTMLGTIGLNGRVVRLVHALSDEEKNYEGNGNGPLAHMQAVLGNGSLTPEEKNVVILIKMSDRIDNIKRRLVRNNLSKNYVAKSKDLIKYLFQHYTGDYEAIMVLRQRLKDLGIKISKKHLPFSFWDV